MTLGPGDWLALAAVHVVASLSPGPDILLVMHRAATAGLRAGLAATAGILTAVTLQATAVVAGIAAMVAYLPGREAVISLVGGVYLCWLGLQAWPRRGRAAESKSAEEPKPTPVATPEVGSAYRAGLLTNLLNPKCLLYFLGVFAVLVPAEAPVSERVGAVAVVVLAQAAAFGMVVWLIQKGAAAVNSPKLQHVLTRVVAGLFMGLGLVLLARGVEAFLARP